MSLLVVLGGGESGVGAAILGKKQGYEVLVSDKGTIKDTYKNVLTHNEIEWEEEKHSVDRLLKASVVVKSPGIPDTAPLIQQLVTNGIAVISEIEWAARYTNASLIGITGSNGKTTTTLLTHFLMQQQNPLVGVAGNIGDSFAKSVATQNLESYVLEISSFQLDGIVDFKPKIAVITNITPDHLDRYNYRFEDYVASKFRIAMNQDKNDYLIYDADDAAILEGLAKHPVQSHLVPFSLTQVQKEGAWLQNDTIHFIIEGKRMEMSTDILPLEGKHNIKNAMAAGLTAMLSQVSKASIRESIVRFQGVPHRLEKVLKINHVEYINDSKATNVNATYYALEGIQKPIIWIAGGVDKGNDYSDLMPLVREKVKAIICLGLDNTKLTNTFGKVMETMVETYSMEEAVKVAYKIAERKDTVLLSPACASFDLFKNYEDRGEQFKTAIKKL